MIDLDDIENEVGTGSNDEALMFTRGEMLELITRMRQAEKLNSELKDRIANIGLDVGIATTGQVPSEHPIKSRLEMVAKLAKDAARYREIAMDAHGIFVASGDQEAADAVYEAAIDVRNN